MDRPIVTDRFVVHRADLGFIHKWQAQMARLIPRCGKAAYNDRYIAYFLLDEAVLSSLLLYAHDAPRVIDFHLEQDRGAGPIRWGGSPKPWQAWIPRTLADFELTVSTIEWARQKGYRTPEIPWQLDRRYARLCHPAAVCRETWQSAMLGAKDHVKTVLGFKRVRQGAATSSAPFDEPRGALAGEASSRRTDPPSRIDAIETREPEQGRAQDVRRSPPERHRQV